MMNSLFRNEKIIKQNLSKYNKSLKQYSICKINNLIFHKKCHFSSIFTDHLIDDDIQEFLFELYPPIYSYINIPFFSKFLISKTKFAFILEESGRNLILKNIKRKNILILTYLAEKKRKVIENSNHIYKKYSNILPKDLSDISLVTEKDGITNKKQKKEINETESTIDNVNANNDITISIDLKINKKYDNQVLNENIEFITNKSGKTDEEIIKMINNLSINNKIINKNEKLNNNKLIYLYYINNKNNLSKNNNNEFNEYKKNNLKDNCEYNKKIFIMNSKLKDRKIINSRNNSNKSKERKNSNSRNKSNKSKESKIINSRNKSNKSKQRKKVNSKNKQTKMPYNKNFINGDINDMNNITTISTNINSYNNTIRDHSKKKINNKYVNERNKNLEEMINLESYSEKILITSMSNKSKELVEKQEIKNKNKVPIINSKENVAKEFFDQKIPIKNTKIINLNKSKEKYDNTKKKKIINNMKKIEINKNYLEYSPQNKKSKQLFIYKNGTNNNNNEIAYGKKIISKKEKSLENKTSKNVNNKFSYKGIEQKKKENIIILKKNKI